MSEHDSRDAKPSAKIQRQTQTPKAAAPAAVAKPAAPAADRNAAAQQINRSLKAWRDRGPGGGGGGGGVKIPGGGGAPLPGGVRQSMEKKLGADLSDVNVHTGGDSSSAAEGLNARAFTTGTDVHFGAGEFNPGSKDGKKLLAHELTHVVQAKRGGISRSPDEGGGEGEKAEGKEQEGGEPAGEKDGEKLEVSDPDEPAEKEADEVSEKVTADEPEGEAKEEKAEGKDGEKAEGGKEEGGGEEGKEAEADEQPAPVAAKALPIAAKLNGVSRKVFRAAPAAAPDYQIRAVAAEAKRITDEIVADAGTMSWNPVSGNYLAHYKPKFAEWVTKFGGQPPAGDAIKAEQARFNASWTFVKGDCAQAVQKAITDMTAADVKKHDGVTAFQNAVTNIAKWRGHMAFGENGIEKDPKWADLKGVQDAKQKDIDDWKKKREDASNDPNLSAAEKARLKYELQLEFCQSVVARITANQDILHKIADFSASRAADFLAEAISGAMTTAAAGLGGLAAIPVFAVTRLAKEAMGTGIDSMNRMIEGARKLNDMASASALKSASPDEINSLATKWQTEGTPLLSFKSALGDISTTLQKQIPVATIKDTVKKAFGAEEMKLEAVKRFMTGDSLDNLAQQVSQAMGSKFVEEYCTAWFAGGSDTVIFKLKDIFGAGKEAFTAYKDLKNAEKELKARGFAVPSA